MKTLEHSAPEYLQQHISDLLARDKRLGHKTPQDITLHLAWRRWAKAKTNEELAAFLMQFRNALYTTEDAFAPIQLEEIAFRLNPHTQ